MHLLAIETSCDETAICVLKAEGELQSPRFEILGSALLSQVELHKPYGGVYPSLAKREHAKNLIPLLIDTLNQTNRLLPKNPDSLDPGLSDKLEQLFSHEPILFERFQDFITNHQQPEKLDAIAVTVGPGLEPALWTGINLAKALHYCWHLPIIPTNHMAGHIASVLLSDTDQTASWPIFPAVALLVSGGHTELVLINNWNDYRTVGQTRDDAAGEAFDKAARLLDLPYPGGPEISKLAQKARRMNLIDHDIQLPRPMLNSPEPEFSFSGLKTALLYQTQKLGDLTDEKKATLAREFEEAVVEVLVKKTYRVATHFQARSIIAAGGVIANQYLRDSLKQMVSDLNLPFFLPEPEFSTDNGAMIAAAGYLAFQADNHPPIAEEIAAEGNLGF